MLNSSYHTVADIYERVVRVIRGMPKEDSFSKLISVLTQYGTNRMDWQCGESDLLGGPTAV